MATWRGINGETCKLHATINLEESLSKMVCHLSFHKMSVQGLIKVLELNLCTIDGTVTFGISYRHGQFLREGIKDEVKPFGNFIFC